MYSKSSNSDQIISVQGIITCALNSIIREKNGYLIVWFVNVGLLVEKKKDGQMDRQNHRTVDTQHRLLICWQKMFVIDFVQVTEMGVFC